MGMVDRCRNSTHNPDAKIGLIQGTELAATHG